MTLLWWGDSKTEDMVTSVVVNKCGWAGKYNIEELTLLLQIASVKRSISRALSYISIASKFPFVEGFTQLLTVLQRNRHLFTTFSYAFNAVLLIMCKHSQIWHWLCGAVDSFLALQQPLPCQTASFLFLEVRLTLSLVDLKPGLS